MKPAEDEFIAHIRESLTEHEEAYVPGAWERFEKKGRRGRGLLWLASLGTAAAALLIGFAVFYTGNKMPAQQVAEYTGAQQAPGPLPGVAGPEAAAKKPVEAARVPRNRNTPLRQKEVFTTAGRNNKTSNPALMVSTAKPDLAAAPVTLTPGQPVQVLKTMPEPIVPATENAAVVTAVDDGMRTKTPVETDPKRSFQEFLDAEMKTAPAMAQAKPAIKKQDKWEMGLVVAPSIGNGKKINMGYGLSMAYALSDKVSIGTGISYSEMGASKDLTRGGDGVQNSPGPATAMVMDTKSLQSVDANLVGLDIPIELKYYFSKKFYTNVGLSAFAVLSQQQSHNYLKGSVESRVSEPMASSGFNAVFTQKSISEPVSPAEARNDKYLGFYNISFGYKQKISDKRSLAVEPFLKLPVKEFTKENLYLLGTGVRLKFDF
jgi:hypothetical protein